MTGKPRFNRLHFPWRRPAAEWTRRLGLAVIVGITAGLAAAALESGLYYGSKHVIGRVIRPDTAQIFHFEWALLILPALGGLLSGLLLRWFSPNAYGHGTDLLVRAFHREGGDMRMRGATVKAVAAVGVISCGGSAGPEGPIAALGAAIGSTLARLAKFTPRDRRMMLIAGCGAGVGAIFQCPMGGALFAAGILYRDSDFESEGIVPAFVASICGYTTYMPFWGGKMPLLGGASGFAFKSAWELLPYAGLGIACGLFGILLYFCLHGVERRPLRRFNLPRWLSPALGGLATGLVACAVPQVMDGQFYFIRRALDGGIHAAQPGWSPLQLAGLFGMVAVAKCVATGLTLGSGASGGVLGPAVFIGGAAGAFVSALVEALAPGLFDAGLHKALIAVGMAGVLSAAMRVPLPAIVMVAEMTGGYYLIVPSMLVCVSAYLIGRRWGLNREQVQTAADSPVHAADAIVHLLQNWRVRDLMQRNWAETVAPGATLREMVARITPGTRPVFAVLDGPRIVGLVSVPDITRIMDEPAVAEAVIAADIMTEDLVEVYPEEDVYAALARMAQDNHIVAPVVSRGMHPVYLGMLSRDDVYAAVRRRLEEMRQHLLIEHEGLAALEQEESLHQLVMGFAPTKRERIQRLLVPIQAVGRSLRESNFRAAFGVQVIAVEEPDGRLHCPPDPDVPLRTDQRLVAVVVEDSIQKAE